MKNIINEIKQYSPLEIELKENIDLTNFSTMKLHALGTIVFVKTIEALKKLIKLLNTNGVQYRLIGMGANQLLPMQFNGIYLKLDFEIDKDNYLLQKDRYYFPANISINFCTNLAISFGLTGFEVLTGIPGTLGGAVFMNAGTKYGDISSIIESIHIVKSDGIEVVLSNELGFFAYRKNNFLAEGDIIVGVTLKILGINPSLGVEIKKYREYRRETQPLNSSTCGCTFKNVQSYKIFSIGLLIEKMGLKGLVMNDVIRISSKHGNFLENLNRAQMGDMLEMIEFIKSQVYLHYGFKIETEVKY
jgi:UDP-N-acetylmuramate dehydrogenase